MKTTGLPAFSDKKLIPILNRDHDRPFDNNVQKFRYVILLYNHFMVHYVHWDEEDAELANEAWWRVVEFRNLRMVRAKGAVYFTCYGIFF